jgi:hypothetical protein
MNIISYSAATLHGQAVIMRKLDEPKMRELWRHLTDRCNMAC